MAISLPSTFQSITSRLRRPLAPLAVSSAGGQTSTVAAPTTSRVPTGTTYLQPGTIPTSSQLKTASNPVAAPAPSGQWFPFAQAQAKAAQAKAAAQAAAAKPMINPQAPPPAGPMINPPAPAAPPPTPPPTAPGAVTQNLTGQEAPFRVTPGTSATQGLQDSAVTAAQRALDNPSPYDDALFKQEVGRGSEALNADLANRGLDYSSIAGDLFSSRVLQPLLSERARSIGDARSQALAGAQSVVGQRTGLEAGARDELRGERSYSDVLRQQARDNSVQQYQLQEGSFQETLRQALASGDPTKALYALNQAAGQYGDQAAGTNDALAQLAKQFATQFYGPQQAAA